jgi:signal transduction histidine kinase
MSSFDNIYMKMTPSLEPSALASLHQEQSLPESDKVIGRQVAHELNNILTILRGYAERMLVKHNENPALRPDLHLINENLRRAERVVRQSTPSRSRVVAGVGL